MRSIAILFCLGIIAPATAQESGSIEAYRQRVRIQNAAIDQQIRQREYAERWQKAKKLFADGTKPTATGPRDASTCLDFKNLQDGQIGRMDCRIVEVLSVIDGDELLFMPSSGDTPVHLKGLSTQGLVDDQEIVILGTMLVHGTYTYDMVNGGQAKVRTVRPLSPEEESKIRDEQARRLELAQKEVEEKLYRTWISEDGKFSIEAKFIEFKGGKVQLQRRDGKVIGVSPSKLSREDREHYRAIVKEKKDPMRGTPFQEPR